MYHKQGFCLLHGNLICVYRNPAFKIVFYQTNQVRMKVYQA